MSALDGTWRVERAGGLLPPLVGVRKEIRGDRGVTRVAGTLGVPFRVEGLSLRYEPPLSAFVDVLEPAPGGYEGRATVLGRTFGRFRLRPVPSSSSPGGERSRASP